MDFLDNMVKSSNAIIKDRLNNPFGNKQQTPKQQQQQQQSNDQPNLDAIEARDAANDALDYSNGAPSTAGQPSPEITTDDQTPLTGSGEQYAIGDKGNSQFASIAADAEAVTQKAVAGAKNFGNFLFSMANKAGQTVSQTAKQVKQAVENTNLLTDMTKEQQEFIKQHGNSIQAAELPWTGYADEAKAIEIREQILSLSQDKRNFVRNPPNDADFQFDPQQCYPIALSLLKEDPNLCNVRCELVPKFVSEESFWCNYFYRVSQLKRFMDEGGDIAKQGWTSSRSSSGEGPDEFVANDEPTHGEDIAAQSPNEPANQPTQQDVSSLIGQELESDESRKIIAEADDLRNRLKELNIGSLEQDS